MKFDGYYKNIISDKEGYNQFINYRYKDYTQVPLVVREKIKEFIENDFDLKIPLTVPVPHEKQLEFLYLQIENFKKGIPESAGMMEQGTGKSKSGITWACWLYQHGHIDRCVVTSPGILKYQWVEEQIAIHCCNNYSAHVWEGMGSVKERNDFGELITEGEGLLFLSINVEALSHQSFKPYMKLFCTGSDKDVHVIIDESTTVKNVDRRPAPGSKRKRKGSKRANMMLDGFGKRKNKIALTGTGAANGPFDLWGQYEILRANYFGLPLMDFQKKYGVMVFRSGMAGVKDHFDLLDKKTFEMVRHNLQVIYGVGRTKRSPNCKKLFCDNCLELGCEKTPLTREIAEKVALSHGLTESAVKSIYEMKEFTKYKNLDELKEQMKEITFFCKASECGDLPPIVYKTIKSRMTPEQRRVYKEMEQEMEVEFEGELLSTLYKQVMRMRCQQIAGGLFPYPVEICKRLANGDSEESIEMAYKRLSTNPKMEDMLQDVETVEGAIVYWARFVEEQRWIFEELVKVYGEEQVVWYHGDTKTKHTAEKLFKSGEVQHFVGSASAAKGLNLQISHRAYCYSNDYDAEKRDQKIKRIARLTQEHSCIITDMVMKGTKDQSILDTVKSKLVVIDKFRTGEEDE